jgi:hypothetical protein
MLRRTASWATQDEEILPSKGEREKAEIVEQVSNDTKIRFWLKRRDSGAEYRHRVPRDDAIR